MTFEQYEIAVDDGLEFGTRTVYYPTSQEDAIDYMVSNFKALCESICFWADSWVSDFELSKRPIITKTHIIEIIKQSTND